MIAKNTEIIFGWKSNG